MSAESQSPAAEEMPEWIGRRIASAREGAAYADRNGMTVMEEDALLVYLADRVDALTRELSESRARAVQGEQVLAQGEASDGYHTHRELYEYRMLYNAHAARGWLAAGVPVVKSWRHSDGEPCFGGGWFIVVAQLPSGQVSNHYRDEFWPLFDVPEVETPPEYDGHTPSDAAVRLREALPRTSTPGDANGQ